MDVEIKVRAKLLPQLIVASAIIQYPSGDNHYIANRCFMASSHDEIREEFDAWRSELEADDYQMVQAVVTHVPQEVYARAMKSQPPNNGR